MIDICHKTLAECGTVCKCGEHELITKSLADAEAVCSCGGWYYAGTGRRSKEHIEREHALHAKRWPTL
jgi:hypothetical protein